MNYYEFELEKAAKVLTVELFKLKPDETFVITADTMSDPQVVNATARAAFAIGAKPMIIWHATPLDLGKDADSMLPVGALSAVLEKADAWAEFDHLIYSSPYYMAMKKNKKLRHLCLVRMNTDIMVRCIGRINFPVLTEFMTKVTEMTKNATHVRITTPAGQDVEFKNAKDKQGNPHPNHPISNNLGYADIPGSHMLTGQIGWTPELESINGSIIFDGTISSGCSSKFLKDPIKLIIKSGKIIEVTGGTQATELETWLRSFSHPQMFRLAHVCYGFNPGAKLMGNTPEDERIWGCTQWGIGAIGTNLIKSGGIPAPSHTDGICLDSTVWLDGNRIMEKGKLILKELKQLAIKLGKE